MITVRRFLRARKSRPPFAGLKASTHLSGFDVFIRHATTVLRFVLQLPAHVLLLLIKIYQQTLSPVLPVIFGSTCGCRFAPTCSHYAADAIRTRGVIVGVILAALRLVKCTPLHPGGFDPVPPRRTRRVCTRITA